MGLYPVWKVVVGVPIMMLLVVARLLGELGPDTDTGNSHTQSHGSFTVSIYFCLSLLRKPILVFY